MLPNKTGTLLLTFILLFGVAVQSHAAEEKESTLEQAFQKEFAFLETQKQELIRRLKKFRSEAKARAGSVANKISAHEMQLQKLDAEIEQLNDDLVKAAHRIEANTENRQSLDSMFDQANASMSDYGFKLSDQVDFVTAKNEQRLAKLYRMADDLLETLGSVRKEKGTFFLANGTQTTGTIVRMGNIAAYGISDSGSGALVPAGEGAFRIYEGEETGAVARAVAEGETPRLLKIFLFESASKAIDQKPEKSAIEVVESGGIIGWVIVTLGLLVVIAIVARIFYLRSASATNNMVLKKVSTLVRKGKLAEALRFCERTKGSTARVVASTLRNIDRERDHLEDIVSESILHESGNLSRFSTFIIVIAAVSPLLGLLGTVTGMITTFDVITEFGTGDPKLLSGGISTALVTTELGLIVAIPALLTGNLLNAWSNRIKENMEKAALRVINMTERAAA